jgi:hypothetical protein
MSSKTVKASSVDQLSNELEELKTSKSKTTKNKRLKEMTKEFATHKKWDLCMECFQLVTDEKERNMLIADLIEEYLLPAKDIAKAKKFAKYLVQEEEQEIRSLVLLRIALTENNWDEAEKCAESLMTPLSRNFAYIHLIEAYLTNKKKDKAKAAHKRILENARTIYDAKIRAYVLRDIAIDLYFANHENTFAKEAAELISDPATRELVLKKIGRSK